MLAVRAEVVQQAGLLEGRDLRTAQQVGGLPGVQRKGGGAGRQAQSLAVRGDELLGGRRVAVAPDGQSG
ncbi:hypothetical protein SMICM17S_09221 [Streptomyces microflavus]